MITRVSLDLDGCTHWLSPGQMSSARHAHLISETRQTMLRRIGAPVGWLVLMAAPV
jgi:hypothetical protein